MKLEPYQNPAIQEIHKPELELATYIYIFRQCAASIYRNVSLIRETNILQQERERDFLNNYQMDESNNETIW